MTFDLFLEKSVCFFNYYGDTLRMDNERIKLILKCFSKEAEIPLLVNGDKTANFFGITSKISKDNIWKYGSVLPIKITYKDLDGKCYTSKLTLAIKDSKAFAGTWLKEDK